jgi:glycerol-3-phosphate dehydrogenase
MNRPEMLSRVNAQTQPWDMLIVGGGATGVGVAVDAASRGYDVLLFEQSDFGKGTSSRSTKVVINATGAFCDTIRQMASAECSPIITPSQGIHLVFDRSFLPGNSAIMVPHTSDGRVLFAIPWHGHTLVGTTDTPIVSPSLEPVPMEVEVEFI